MVPEDKIAETDGESIDHESDVRKARKESTCSEPRLKNSEKGSWVGSWYPFFGTFLLFLTSSKSFQRQWDGDGSGGSGRRRIERPRSRRLATYGRERRDDNDPWYARNKSD